MLLYGGLGALAACTNDAGRPVGRTSAERHEWRMVTSWPENFPGFGASANRLAERISRLSDGRLQIDVYAAGELIPAFEVFDSVSRGQMQMGHSSPTYWRGVLPAAVIFSAVPFGMLPHAHKTWIYQGGGLPLWREIYGEHGIVPFMAGNTGAQMGGWFKREIRSLADIEGLKMRISGLGAEVMARAGAVTVNLPGAELYTSLATGAIDATEWNGPFNDMAFGLHEVADYYYYPGWHEPSGVLECLVSSEAWAALPPFLQAVVETACMAESEFVITEFAARNEQARLSLIEEHGTQFRPFPDDVLTALRGHTDEVMTELSESDPVFARAYAAYRTYAESISSWFVISEGVHCNAQGA
jgi:TRAP-type mannitol/chloroaromatic compound transport system substrate-binding protein